MSEEISRPIIRSYKIWKNPGIHWKDKIIEIIIEVCIIVFAVSFSLYLERWREERNDRTTEMQFLTGLKHDLQEDMKELSTDSAFYTRESMAYQYFYTTVNYNPDSVNLYKPLLSDYTQLIPNTNRYEALKSSGKLDVITNTALLDSIVDLYQDKIPALIEVFIKPFLASKTNEFFPFLDNNIVMGIDGRENLEQVLKMPLARNFIKKWYVPDLIASRYHAIIDADKSIVAEIDKIVEINFREGSILQKQANHITRFSSTRNVAKSFGHARSAEKIF